MLKRHKALLLLTYELLLFLIATIHISTGLLSFDTSLIFSDLSTDKMLKVHLSQTDLSVPALLVCGLSYQCMLQRGL